METPKILIFLTRAISYASTDTAATFFEISQGMRQQIQTQFDDSIHSFTNQWCFYNY